MNNDVQSSRKLRRNRRALVLGLMLILLLSCQSSRPAPEADGGQINLPSEAAGQEPIKLSGEWYFYPNEWVQPSDLEQRIQEAPSIVEVPSFWSSKPERLEPTGIATYALILDFPQAGPWALLPPMVDTAATISLWNPQTAELEFELQRGQPSRTPDAERLAGKGSAIKEFSVDSPGSRILLLHVSNHRHASGSVWMPPVLGEATTLRNTLLWRYILSAALVGILLFTALYHLTLYAAERTLRSNLSFSFFAAAVLLRELSTVGYGADFGLNLELLERIEYTSMALMPMACIVYLSDLFQSFDAHKTLRRTAMLSGIPLAALPFIVLPSIYTGLVVFYQLYVVGIGTLMGIRLITLRRAQIPFSGHVLWAMVTIVLLTVQDVFVHFGLINSVLLGPLGLVGFLLVQTWISAQLAKQAANERFALREKVLQQSLQVSEEARKAEQAKQAQSLAEQEAHITATSRVNLFSSAVHHLNNPLNHIQGGMMTLAKTTQQTYASIFAVIDPNDEDPDAQRFYKTLRHNQLDASQSIDIMTQGIERAMESIDYLRVLSGIDGVSFQGAVIGNILDIVFGRMKDDLRNCSWSGLKEVAELPCFGHPVLYAQSLETVLITMIQNHRTITGIELQSGEDVHVFCIKTTPRASAEPKTQTPKQLKTGQDLAAFVLRNYRCRVDIQEETATVEVLAKLPEGGIVT